MDEAKSSSAAQDIGQSNAAMLRERQAFHTGTLAYLYAYPIVDMLKQMHNETHRVSENQQIYAPVNHFYVYDYLITPRTAGNLRSPNNDTLYFGGWFDLGEEPIIIHAPDTKGRYYTLGVTDFYAESHHIGRRTTGTLKKYFALVGPNWKGKLPPYIHVVKIPTPKAWILGRMLVDGEADFGAAMALVKSFWAAPLSVFQPDAPPAPVLEENKSEAVNPFGSLEFFKYLNSWLRLHAGEEGEQALMKLFDQIGVGPESVFELENSDESTLEGLKKALVEGELMVKASTQTKMSDVRNGWVFPKGLGRYGQDYLFRASIVKGGYANAEEESTYAAQVFDQKGQFLKGDTKYTLHFLPDEIPPANAFWSISAYHLKDSNLIENSIGRYSIGDRTSDLKTNADGSIDLFVQHREPEQGASNWLPVGEDCFYLVMRIYEPGHSVFDGSYSPPRLLETS